MAYENTGRKHLAVADFSQLIRLNPDRPNSYVMRGSLYLKDGKLDQAIIDLNKAATLDPDSTLTLFHRSTAYMLEGQFDMAITDADNIVRLAPEWNLSLISRATAYMGNEDYDLSIADWDRVIQLTPGFAQAYLSKAEALNAKAWILATSASPEKRNGRKAIGIAQQALALSNDPLFRDTLAAAYAEAGRFDDAVAEQQRAIDSLRQSGRLENLAELETHLNLYRQSRPMQD